MDDAWSTERTYPVARLAYASRLAARLCGSEGQPLAGRRCSRPLPTAPAAVAALRASR